MRWRALRYWVQDAVEWAMWVLFDASIALPLALSGLAVFLLILATGVGR